MVGPKSRARAPSSKLTVEGKALTYGGKLLMASKLNKNKTFGRHDFFFFSNERYVLKCGNFRTGRTQELSILYLFSEAWLGSYGIGDVIELFQSMQTKGFGYIRKEGKEYFFRICEEKLRSSYVELGLTLQAVERALGEEAKIAKKYAHLLEGTWPKKKLLCFPCSVSKKKPWPNPFFNQRFSRRPKFLMERRLKRANKWTKVLFPRYFYKSHKFNDYMNFLCMTLFWYLQGVEPTPSTSGIADKEVPCSSQAVSQSASEVAIRK